MALSSDTIESIEQIADDLEERINAGPHVFYGSTFTKSDYCKNLIEPLLKKHHIDTLLESLPPHDAESLREKYSKLMSCFDANGELFNQGLPLTTINRYANALIKELREIAQGSKRDTTAAKQKAVRPGPQRKHSDEKLQQALVSFEKFNLEFNDAKKAWDHVARHHGFESWTAARQACYRFRKKTKQVT